MVKKNKGPEGSYGDHPETPTTTGKQKIALCMIVKDEEAVITRCFDSVRDFVDYYVICDTGSTDDTIKVIKEYWEEHNLEGEIHERPWVNFAHNRTEALNYGASASVDYLMTLDADEVIAPLKDGVVKLDHKVVELPNMEGDTIYVTTMFGSVNYKRTQFVKRGLAWRWEEPVHEYCWAPDAKSTQHLSDICCYPSTDGGRSADPNKYKRDALTFESYILDNPENWRSYFYLAQSYRDAGQPEKALGPLQVAIENCVWDDEKFIARLRKARYRLELDEPFENVIGDYLEAYNFMPSRAEPLFALLSHYRIQGDWEAAILFGEKALTIPYPHEAALFVEHQIYNWQIKDELSLAYFYAGRYLDALYLGDELAEIATAGKIPDDQLQRLEGNLISYRGAVDEHG